MLKLQFGSLKKTNVSFNSIKITIVFLKFLAIILDNYMLDKLIKQLWVRRNLSSFTGFQPGSNPTHSPRGILKPNNNFIIVTFHGILFEYYSIWYAPFYTKLT